MLFYNFVMICRNKYDFFNHFITHSGAQIQLSSEMRVHVSVDICVFDQDPFLNEHDNTHPEYL